MYLPFHMRINNGNHTIESENNNSNSKFKSDSKILVSVKKTPLNNEVFNSKKKLNCKEMPEPDLIENVALKEENQQ